MDCVAYSEATHCPLSYQFMDWIATMKTRNNIPL